MSDRIIKLLGEQITLSANTPTTVGSAQLVRIHPHAEVVLTVKDGSTITGSCTLHQEQAFYIRKKPTETIEVDGNNCTVVAVGFGD